MIRVPRGLHALALLCASISVSCSSTAPVGPAAPRLTPIVILSTNDFHGALAPVKFQTREKDGVAPTEYEIGGAANLAGYVNLLREEYGPSLLWLDGGDEFQGSLESNREEGAPVVRFFSAAGLDAAAVGNHEFDFGPAGPEDSVGDRRGALRARMREARYTFLSANVASVSPGVNPLPESRRSKMFNVNGVKVGVIGLITTETPVMTRPEFVRDLRFLSLADETVKEAAALRSKGAEVVIVTAHVGANCGNKDQPTAVFKPDDSQTPCPADAELVQFLKAIPAGTVDAVVAGHSHTILHNWIAGVPAIQSASRARYIGLIHLQYDRVEKRIVTELTRIESPIPVCPQFFEKQGNCDGGAAAPAGGRGTLVPATFHSRPVRADSRIEALLRPTFEKVAALKNRVIGTAAQPVPHPSGGESSMGNLVADAIREKAGTDFAMTNFGGVRAGIDAGPITFGEMFMVLPFDNQIEVLQVTGAELRTIVRVAESDAGGYFPLSGLRVRLLAKDQPGQPEDLNGDGRQERWEVNRVVELTRTNGETIIDDQMYTLALPDFLVQGGDYMGWPISQVPADRVQAVSGVTLRDAAVEAISRRKVVNSPADPLIVPDKPRIRFN